MTKSQNTKNEQQKDLCITSEQLTEQWKNWQLEGFRWYYVKFITGETDICWLTEWSDDELGTGGQYFDGIKEENILEVLAPVPSYEEWKGKDDALTSLLAEYGKLTKKLQDEKEKHMARPSLRSPADEMVIEKQVWESTLNRSMVLEAENYKLKELLEECRHIIGIEKDFASCHFEEYTLVELLTKIDEVLK